MNFGEEFMYRQGRSWGFGNLRKWLRVWWLTSCECECVNCYSVPAECCCTALLNSQMMWVSILCVCSELLVNIYIYGVC